MVQFVIILLETLGKLIRNGCSEKCHKQRCIKGNSHMRHTCIQYVSTNGRNKSTSHQINQKWAKIGENR